MGISDLIASFLQESLEETDGGVLEVQRNDLAQRFNCVPSQINYVMSTRFSPERGYIVESRRGGNGYIRITRVRVDRQTLLMQVINTLGSQVDLASARAILNNLVQAGALEENAGRSILAAVGDKALAAVPRESRDTVRADIMKQVLIDRIYLGYRKPLWVQHPQSGTAWHSRFSRAAPGPRRKSPRPGCRTRSPARRSGTSWPPCR